MCVRMGAHTYVNPKGLKHAKEKENPQHPPREHESSQPQSLLWVSPVTSQIGKIGANVGSDV